MINMNSFYLIEMNSKYLLHISEYRLFKWFDFVWKKPIKISNNIISYDIYSDISRNIFVKNNKDLSIYLTKIQKESEIIQTIKLAPDNLHMCRLIKIQDDRELNIKIHKIM